MLLSLVVFIGSLRVAQANTCHNTSDTCRISFDFDQSLNDDRLWIPACIKQTTGAHCIAVANADYVQRKTTIELYASRTTGTATNSNQTDALQTQMGIQISPKVVMIILYVECPTKDFCATEIIRRLLPKFNTLKGRSMQIYDDLKEQVMEPTAEQLNAGKPLECFDSSTNKTAPCTNMTMCELVDVKQFATVNAGCTSDSDRLLVFGYLQDLDEKINDVYSELQCGRSNCNSPASYERVRKWSEAFIRGKDTSSSSEGSSSTTPVTFGVLLLTVMALQLGVHHNGFA